MVNIILNFRPAVLTILLSTVLLCGVYPAVVTVFGQMFFSKQANGSLIRNSNGIVIGSELIGQNFAGDKYFWGRNSATGPSAYNAAASSGSNLGPNNPTLLDGIKAKSDTLKAGSDKSIPVDLVTASGSGLDPQISPEAALFQVDRVAKARGINAEKVTELVNKYTENRQLGILGERRVNVLELNLALDKLK